ncbi:putative adenylyl- / guanylyl cyclase, catalytic domain [Lyophyllum shimeji]|uniref:Adenylate cyclase n=1 Tax=Lyophyllum shimeji TaxID=47721 RepID=A0A9P3UUQ6_LYOSH|nr:putative adenylyl- / guanylyl cyclase, catalytic domain [Lyophyllum shimeji]
MNLAHRSSPSNHILLEQPRTHSPTSHTPTTAPTSTSVGNLSVNRESVIAPWDDPPTPPPKAASRSFGFSSKSSFSTFSGSNLLRQPRRSDSHSTLSTTEDKRRSAEDDSARRLLGSGSSATLGSQGELRKAKSSIFSKLTRSRSRSGLRQDSIDGEHPSLKPPPPVPDAYVSFLPIPGPPAHSNPSSILSKKDRREKKKKNSGTRPPSPPPKDQPGEPEITLDTNIDVMDGIVDLTLPSGPIHDASSPSSGLDSSTDHSSFYNSTFPDFRNPFLPTPAASKRNGRIMYKDTRRISPKDRVIPVGLPGYDDGKMLPAPRLPGSGPGSPTWTAPESWAVEKEGADVAEAEYSSSDDSVANGGVGRMSFAANTELPIHAIPNDLVPNILLHPTAAAAAAQKRKRRRMPGKRPLEKPFTIRIYRANNTFHIASLAPHASVANLMPALNEKLLLGKDTETHRLYLKERGRERILGQAERPADIVRRRLEQAGYDPADGLELLGGEGLSFLLKFVYKSELLGPTEEELAPETFDHIDLTGRGLRTIPVILHQHADQIVSLKLSRNPMLEIPLDFIQSCTTLRELRLSNMAMKKVPQSVRHAASLNRLDLSSNRISDLEEAFLDHITGLSTLLVQNNRIEKLPWYFPRLRHLVTLNISNNKFRTLPTVVCQLEALRDLDCSFNMISELPDELGQLKHLERLVIVGNQVSRFPDECSQLVSLASLDCRRNNISDLSIMSMLPRLTNLSADHNAVHGLDLALGPCLTVLDASHNEITQLSLVPGPVGRPPYALTSLDISHAKLSSLDDLALGHLSSLRRLRLDHNSFRAIPETLGDLTYLEYLSCSDNKLNALPASIGRLQRLEVLDAHNNSLTELPITLWNCASLVKINVTSNFLGFWHDPPVMPMADTPTTSGAGEALLPPGAGVQRKTSTASLGTNASTGRILPPLVHSLERLYLGENRLTDDALHPIMQFKELRVLNLSFNELQDLPSRFFCHLTMLEELYLSGNKLTSIPTEELPKLKRLMTLYLNGNKLHTLPPELGKVQNLMILDVGSNLLKYNVNNWEFDWNWNFNKNLKYLNLSGNNRLQIRPDPNKHLHRRHSMTRTVPGAQPPQMLSGFTDLTQLRVLGLMDVTITTTVTNAIVDIPDENEDRRVRTSLSTVLGMAYGIADAIGRGEHDCLNMLDLVHEFRNRPGEAIFAMFGRSQPPKALPPGASPNRLAKFLRDKFVSVLLAQLSALNIKQGEGVPNALRRTFLKLNQDLHDSLFTSTRKMSTASGTGAGGVVADPATLRSGVSGIVVYFVGKTIYVANVGNALAVVSRQGTAHPVARKHDPFDHEETARIRAAEGWVSPPGLVNDEVDVSRAFGFYHLLPIINARPDIFPYEISPQDEFVIIANRGLWDLVSYQTAVDIARTERGDPMIAAQKLRDFAISYGAEGSTMIMVIGLGETPETGVPKKKNQILDRMIERLDGEVPAPVGHIALVFSDIRNSTHLWEVNPGMATAHKLHNTLLRRQLRFCGGYEVKTEGDSFMCSFPTSLAAVWWCLRVQYQLLHEPWPLEILECEDGKPIYDDNGTLIARGLSVRMGIHCGSPSPEPDPITGRMDYFGSMVNRAARICGNALGGQIMCSAEIIREINASIYRTEPETEYSKVQPQAAIDGILRMRVAVVPIGEVKLKGLEVPEYISAIYPAELAGRQDWGPTGPTPSVSGSRIPFNVDQMRELGLICLRLETLTTLRVFRPLPERKGSIQTLSLGTDAGESGSSLELYGDPNILLPPMSSRTDAELMALLDSLATRIVNATLTLKQMYLPQDVSPLSKEAIKSAFEARGEFDERTLEQILSVLDSI